MAAGFETGKLHPESVFIDERRSYPNGKGGSWRPRNFDDLYTEREMTLAEGLTRSVNTIAVQALAAVGVSTVVGLCQRIGLTGNLPEDLSLALGSASVSPLKLTAAFAPFASGGMYHEPQFVHRVITSGGENIWPGRTSPRQVFSEETVHAMDKMLRAVVDEGTGRNAAIEGLEVAGKTGTSNGARDSWFVGYTENLVAGVWVGYDAFRAVRRGGGGVVAAPLWRDFVRAVPRSRREASSREDRNIVPTRPSRLTLR